jgi:hypothetical protein
VDLSSLVPSPGERINYHRHPAEPKEIAYGLGFISGWAF